MILIKKIGSKKIFTIAALMTLVIAVSVILITTRAFAQASVAQDIVYTNNIKPSIIRLSDASSDKNYLAVFTESAGTYTLVDTEVIAEDKVSIKNINSSTPVYYVAILDKSLVPSDYDQKTIDYFNTNSITLKSIEVQNDILAPTASDVSISKDDLVLKDINDTDYVKTGDTFKIRFTLADAINGVDAQSISAKVGNTTLINDSTNLVYDSTTGKGIATFTIDSSTIENLQDGNEFPFTLSYADNSGNLASTTTVSGNGDGSKLILDNSISTASNVSISKEDSILTNTDYVTTGDTFKVRFTLANNGSGIDGQSVSVKMGELANTIPTYDSNTGVWAAAFTANSETTKDLLPGNELNFNINYKDNKGRLSSTAATSGTGAGSKVIFDNVAPTANNVSISKDDTDLTDKDYVKTGDTFKVRFTLTDMDGIGVNGDTVSAKIGGTKLIKGDSNLVYNITTGVWTATFKADPITTGGLKEGEAFNFTLSYADNLGNATSISKVTDNEDGSKSQVILNNTAPKAKNVSISKDDSILDNHDFVRLGDTFKVRFTLYDSLSNVDEKTVAVKVGSTTDDSLTKEALTYDNATGTYTAIFDVDLDTLNGVLEGSEIPYTISYSDTTGNASSTTQLSDPEAVGQVTYDNTPPAITDISISKDDTLNNIDYVKVDDNFTVKFKLADALSGDDTTNAKVQIGGTEITAIPSEPASDGIYTASFKADDQTINNLAEGNEIPFAINCKDLAGNPSSATAVSGIGLGGKVIYDNTAPSVTLVSLVKATGTQYPGWIKQGDTFTLKLNLDKTKGGTLASDKVSGVDLDKLTATVGNTTQKLTKTSGTIENGTFEATFTANQDTLLDLKDSDAIPFAINYSDMAGNIGTTVKATTDGSSIRYDNSNPIIKYSFNGVETDASNLQSFYKSNNLSIQITEHNFDPNGISVEGNNIKPTNWVNKGNDLWQMNITMPDSNNNTLKVTATDAVGNKSINDLTNSKSFSIDTTTPVIKYLLNGTGTDKPSRYYKASQQLAIQISEHNFNPSKTAVTGNGISPTSWINKGNDLWEMVINLNEGNDYTLTVKTTDNADNSASKSLDTFTIDITKPVVSIQNIFGGFFKGTLTPRVVYSDINLDPNSVSIKLNGVEKGVGTAAAAAFEKALSIKDDGTYDLSVSVQDLAGNVSTQEITFVLDNTAPKITSISIDLKNPVAYPMGWIPGKELKIDDANGYDIVTSTLNGVDYDIDTPITNEGKNTLYLKVIDKSGNVSALTYQFFIDNTAPKIICMDSINNVTLDSTSQDAVFISQMNLNVYLDKIEIGNEKQDDFTAILLEDENGNVVQDLLHTVVVKTEGEKKSYSLLLTKFQPYKLVVKARDDVGNVTSNTYAFTLKDKSIFTKYYENKAVFYSSITIFALLIIGFAGFGFTRLGRKTKI